MSFCSFFFLFPPARDVVVQGEGNFGLLHRLTWYNIITYGCEITASQALEARVLVFLFLMKNGQQQQQQQPILRLAPLFTAASCIFSFCPVVQSSHHYILLYVGR
jgi:hypothetical protein